MKKTVKASCISLHKMQDMKRESEPLDFLSLPVSVVAQICDPSDNGKAMKNALKKINVPLPDQPKKQANSAYYDELSSSPIYQQAATTEVLSDELKSKYEELVRTISKKHGRRPRSTLYKIRGTYLEKHALARFKKEYDLECKKPERNAMNWFCLEFRQFHVLQPTTKCAQFIGCCDALGKNFIVEIKTRHSAKTLRHKPSYKEYIQLYLYMAMYRKEKCYYVQALDGKNYTTVVTCMQARKVFLVHEDKAVAYMKMILEYPEHILREMAGTVLSSNRHK